MNSLRQNILLSLFNEGLDGIKYVLLKHICGPIVNLPKSSDIDVLVEPSDSSKIITYLQGHSDVAAIKRQVGEKMIQLFILLKDGSFLQVDLLFDFIRKGVIYLDKKSVFDASRKVNGIKVYSPNLLAEHVLLFNYLNHSGINSSYTRFLEKNGEPSQILKEINEKYGTAFTSLQQFEKFDQKEATKMIETIDKDSINSPLKKLTRKMTYSGITLSRLLNPPGKIITFSGVDGAGKSTIISKMVQKIENDFDKNVVVLRHRPGILPILSSYKYGKQEAEKRAADRMPRQGSNKSSLGSIFRFGYYYMDYLFGQFYVRAKYTSKGYYVLFDRYYFDFVADMKRSNIQLPRGLTKWFYRFVQKADLNFFLYAKPEVILARKQELDAESINTLTADYLSLFEEFNGNNKEQKYIPIENNILNETLGTIQSHIQKIVTA